MFQFFNSYTCFVGTIIVIIIIVVFRGKFIYFWEISIKETNKQ